MARWIKLGAAIGGIAILASAAGIAVEHVWKPSDWVIGLASRIEPDVEQEAVQRFPVESAFLAFEAEAIQVPVTRFARGGGLTVLDGNVLLATVDGKLYIASGPDDLRPLSIETPDYDFDEYKAFADDPANSQYKHAFWGYRYSDLLFFRNGGKAMLGLAFIHFDRANVCFRTEVQVLEVPGTAAALSDFTANAGAWRKLFETSPCLPLKTKESAIEAHLGGGRLASDGKGTLYLSSGDYHFDGIFFDGAPISPDPAYDYGKVIAIDLATGDNRQITRGHRNMQGISFDAQGRLWTLEHGMRGGDELNLEVEGQDYGWPRESYSTLYNRLPIPGALSYGRHDTFFPPVFAFVPSIAPSSLNLIQGFHPAWDGDFLVSTLKNRALYRIHLRDDRVEFAERIEIGERIRDAEQLDGERLVYITDDQKLVFLTRKENASAEQFLTDYAAQPEADPAKMERLVAHMRQCLECHSLDPNVNEGAPTLAGIVGAPVAGAPFPGYSDALKSLGGTWTEERLTEYLSAPAAAAPGTVMPDPGLTDAADIQAIVEFLSATSSPLVFTGPNE